MEKSKSDTYKEFFAELDNNLKEMRDMIMVLGQDCKEQYLATQSEDKQMYRRAYVRSVFACIEGVLHRMKLTAAYFGQILGTLTVAEMILIEGASFDVDDKGEVIPKPVFVKFLNNVRFGFRVFSKSIGSSFDLVVGGVGWGNLRDAVKVRDRLMHPKVSTNLEITDTEIKATANALNWFLISHALCSLHAQMATHVKTSRPPEDIAALKAKILNLETELKKAGN